MITSLANPKVKFARALHHRKARARERHFLIEGLRLVEAAVEAGVVPKFVFYIASFVDDPRGDQLIQTLLEQGATVELVSEAVLKTLADTVTPQGIVAVVPFVTLSPPSNPTLSLILDSLRDPGNVGTVLRSALAAGVDEVLIAPRTVDVYNAKVVRAAMGAHFRLPIIHCRNWEGVREHVGDRPVWLADVNATRPYYAVDWTRPCALIISNEATGPSSEARETASGSIRIPMRGPAESLNAAIAASVILFEALRQRETT